MELSSPKLFVASLLRALNSGQKFIDNILIIERRRKFQYLFQGVFKILLFFKITSTITYTTAVSLCDLFESFPTSTLEMVNRGRPILTRMRF